MIWAKTNFGQYFVFFFSKALAWYAVRLIVNEEYWEYSVVYYQNIESKNINEKRQFLTLEKAKLYIEEKLKNISENKFGKELKHWLREVPEGFLQNPDDYLKRGTHIQRYLKGKLAKTVETRSHEGIYLGNSKVAHLSADDGVNLTTNHKAYSKINTLEKFLEILDEELRIVDHFFRQCDQKSIVKIAKTIVEDYFYLQANDRLPYVDGRVAQKQLPTFCAIGDEMMTESDRIVKSIKKVTIPSGIIVGLAVLSMSLGGANDRKSQNSEEYNVIYDQQTWNDEENKKE